MDPGMRFLEHRLPGTHRPVEEHPVGQVQVQVLHMQAEEERGVHPVQQEELLRSVPRYLRSGLY